jgi:squalene cyclase
VQWLVSLQNEDGGWGEDGMSYKLEYRGYESAPSTPSQTAWALLGLMAGGAVEHTAVARGVAYLLRAQREHGLWDAGSLRDATVARIAETCVCRPLVLSALSLVTLPL